MTSKERTLCSEFAAQRKQLKWLQTAYREHLHGNDRGRLPWLERGIDMQRETVKQLQRERDKLLPFGCLDCPVQQDCPYRLLLQAVGRVK